MTQRPDDDPTVVRRRSVVRIRGGIGIVAGTLSLLRPEAAPLILGIALIIASLLELAIPQAPDDPSRTVRGHRRRGIWAVTGVGVGVALLASSRGGSTLETQVLAVTLAGLAVVDGWASWHATVPGTRRIRAIRAALATAVALVLVVVPAVALGIVLLVAAVGWIAIGTIEIVGSGQADRTQPDDPSPPHGVADVISGWLSRRDIGDDFRDQILTAYDYDPADGERLARFSILLILASVIASAGLIGNSVASIIGAMIIAPLMGPIVGIAVGIVTGLPSRTVRCLMVSILGIGLTVVIGFVMGAWLGSAPSVIANSEILARTSPNILDLVVALAAGAAGAYAASNSKVADSLPGVAIAIALVPPLATAGILISHNDWSLASGAMLLFITNFVSIVVAASVVFVLVGVVPIGRLAQNAERTQGWFATFAVAGILLLIPLTVGGRQAIIVANETQLVTGIVEEWLAPVPGFTIVTLDVIDGQVDVAVAGPDRPPDPADLQAALDEAMGTAVALDLRVVPTFVYSSVPTPSALSSPEP